MNITCCTKKAISIIKIRAYEKNVYDITNEKRKITNTKRKIPIRKRNKQTKNRIWIIKKAAAKKGKSITLKTVQYKNTKTKWEE